jgi:hypothetical protein
VEEELIIVLWVFGGISWGKRFFADDDSPSVSIGFMAATSSAFHFDILEHVSDEGVEGIAAYFHSSAYFAEGVSLFDEFADDVFFTGELTFFGFATFWSSKDYSFFFLSGECFLGALRDQVSFDFGTQAKREGKDFAVQVISEFIIFLSRINHYFLFHAEMEEIHYVH